MFVDFKTGWITISRNIGRKDVPVLVLGLLENQTRLSINFFLEIHIDKTKKTFLRLYFYLKNY